jgi:hypothetical protein
VQISGDVADELGAGKAAGVGCRHHSPVKLHSDKRGTNPASHLSYSFVSLRWTCSRQAAIAKTAVRPSQGRRSRRVMIIVPLS